MYLFSCHSTLLHTEAVDLFKLFKSSFIVLYVFSCLSPAFQTSVVHLSLHLSLHSFGKNSTEQKLFLAP